MENKKAYLILALIFLASFALNLYALTYKPLHEEAYFSLRYAGHIKENFTPLSRDELSYGGRSIEEPFLFYYLLSASSYIHPVSAKVIAALIVASLVLIIFFISNSFVSKGLSLIPALFAAFTSVLFKINIISTYIFGFLLLFLLIYSFGRINDKKFLYLFLALSLILPLSSFLSIFYIFAVLVFILIAAIEGKKLSALEWEASIFSVFVNVLVLLLLFRNSLLTYGPSFIWQNIPSEILAEYFRTFAPIEAIGNIGIASLVIGTIGFVFSFRDKSSLMLSSFFIATMTFLWLKLIPFNIGLILLSLSLAVLSSISLKVFSPYIKETKFSKFRNIIVIVIFVVAILSSAIPAVLALVNYESEISDVSFKAISSLEKSNITILATYEFGHAITFTGNRNVADSLFLLAPQAENRIKDIRIAYTSQSETPVLEIMRRYGVDYIILDEYTREKFKIEELSYLSDKKCFSNVYNEEKVKIYRFKC